jgi:hypothetical protein
MNLIIADKGSKSSSHRLGSIRNKIAHADRPKLPIL